MLKSLQKEAITMLAETSLAVERVESDGEFDQAYPTPIVEDDEETWDADQDQELLSYARAGEFGRVIQDEEQRSVEMDIQDEFGSQDGKGIDVPQQDEEMLDV